VGDLKGQARAVQQEVEETRRQLAQEAERLGENRRQAAALEEQVREAGAHLQALGQELHETRALLQAVRQQAAETAPAPGELREYAGRVAAEVGEAHRFVLAEAENLAELRDRGDAVRQGLTGVEGRLAEMDRRLAEAGPLLAERMAAPLERTGQDFEETRGLLQALRREVEGAAEEAAALRRHARANAGEFEAAAGERRVAAVAAALANVADDRGAEGAGGDAPAERAPEPGGAAHLGLSVEVDSAVVLGVEPGTRAAEAGIKPGDVITAVNGRPVSSGAELREAVARLAPDEPAVLDVKRAGAAEASADAPAPDLARPADHPAEAAAPVAAIDEAGDRPAEPNPEAAFGEFTPPAEPGGAVELGLTVAMDSGVVVGVAPGTRAERAGIKPGDVITAINGRPVNSGAALREAVAALTPDEPAVLEFQRPPEPAPSS
jgi:S1-C subfamily serine protease